ncbi:MAG TPA: hypothetical protein VFC68_00150, partial [Treponemataceae bacterium]|nr:hypothetical protein [Treponemataceae bacterium]
ISTNEIKLKEEEKMNLNEISTTISQVNKKHIDNAYLLNPFNIIYERSDMHVMLYFTGHAKYEAIEATISEKNTNDIRVIITRHDQTQIDYMNNREKVDKIQEADINREVYYAQINFKNNRKSSKPEVILQFRTVDNEQVDFKLLCVSKPSKTHAGLTDPEGHSAKTSLPLMYRDLSTLASNKSSVQIDGIKYTIPVLIHVPIFFTGLKGYYSENFKMGIIRTGERDTDIIESPSAYEVGNKWVYKTDDRLSEYTITKIETSNITITSLNEIISGVLINDTIGIITIGISAVGDTSSMLISFDTPLFNNLDCDSETGFSISIDENKNLITGTVKYKSKPEGQEYQLNPSEPTWALSRKMDMVIHQDFHTINWKSVIDVNE